MSANDFARLAMYVRARREHLDLTQMQIYREGGPSDTKLGEIENVAERISAATLRKLDIGLRWEPGSARRILMEAGDPRPAVGGSAQDAPEENYVENILGDRADAGITNADLYRELLRQRAEYDQLRADVRSVSERVAKLEEPRP